MRQFSLAQPELAAALMKSGLDAEFVAVPGADDVAVSLVIFLRPRGLVARDRLEHALHDAALADRAGAMRAAVMPSIEFVADAEHPDFLVPAHDHLAIAVGIVVDVARHVLGHRPLQTLLADAHADCRRACATTVRAVRRPTVSIGI